ncbi:MAG TPA: glycosyltransferase family 2 protein [Burkholderiales bacterium]
MSHRTPNHVCAVVVSYHPERDVLREVLAAARPQVDELVVVDNGSSPQTVEWLAGLAREHDFHVLPLGRNLGIASAHNAGIAWARENKSAYVLLLDQDSTPDHAMVDELLRADRELRARGAQVSAVGPQYRDASRGHASFFVRFGLVKFMRLYCDSGVCGQRIPADFLISSGSLMSMDALTAIGGMDDGLFIDHVDTDWFLRARHRGYQAFGVCDAVMLHSLGSGTSRIWLGRWRHVARHGPLRHYYNFRNSLLLYRRPYAPARWILTDITRLAGLFFFHALFTPPRREQVAMMLKGIVDGVRGHGGPLGRQ